MNCPSCGTAAPSGAAHCKRCGAALGAKAAPAADPDELDLMPLEPAKPPAHSSFEPPADLAPPPAIGKGGMKDYSQPPIPGSPGRKVRGAMASPAKSMRGMIIGGLLALGLFGLVGYRIFRTKNEVVVGNPKVGQAFTIQPGSTKVENLEVTGKVPYVFEVTALDAEILVAIFQRSPKDPSNLAALKSLAEGFETVKKGDTHLVKGDLVAGQYSWVVANEGKKAARAKVKFVAQP